MTSLILASASKARIALLTAAGVAFTARTAPIDERAIAAPLLADGRTPGEVASALADAKALAVSRIAAGSMVIGADQALDFDGAMWVKPPSVAAARKQIVRLSGREHRLDSAVSVAEGGVVRWRHLASVRLAMRALTSAEVDAYIARAGEAALASVGGYQVESLGIQLFDKIDGDYFAILGLPLLPLFAYLRAAGAVSLAQG